MRIIIMGPPGVGKGTQATTIAEDLNIPHVSTGDIFRALFRSEDPIGNTVKGYLDKGLLVPDELTNKVVETRFKQDDIQQGFIFDGYPRNVFQAKAFKEYLDENKLSIDVVINIDAKDDVIIDRLSGRRVCPTCGKTYHMESNKPLNDTLCDIDNTPLIQREDDKPETIKKRLSIYHEQTKPLVDFYENLGLLKTVDGSGDIKESHDQIRNVLRSLKWLTLNHLEKLN